MLYFWFVESTPKQHYTKDDAFDEYIKNQFEVYYWSIVEGKTAHWRETPSGRLAEIIVLDQFARNMFRDDEQSFAADELALTLAKEALEVGADAELSPEQREFFYMPFMHSESKDVHVEALKIFKEKASPAGLKFEIKHKEIIDEFDRYPHRNKVLGRNSTDAELEFLKENPGF